MEEKKNQIVEVADRILAGSGRYRPGSVTGVADLAGDGSQRLFFRLRIADGGTAVAVVPATGELSDLAEARSTWWLACHLYNAGVPVPEPFANDPGSGMVLFEDLGDKRLFDLLRERGESDSFVSGLYREAVRTLATMQTVGREGFDPSWCWQTPYYDRQLMLDRESGYFYQALCRDYFGLEPNVQGLYREFKYIAGQAASAPAVYFLHRDFQSRNLMIKDRRVRIIDFQGGRLGPLGYDLASLLLDPYAGLSRNTRDDLLEEYLTALQTHLAYDPVLFRREYHYLCLQRNLQILGAFAYLGHTRGKKFFLPFIQPALNSLSGLLAQSDDRQYPFLQDLVTTCLARSESSDS